MVLCMTDFSKKYISLKIALNMVFLSQSRHLGILLVQSEYYLIKYCMLDDRARHCEITFVKNIENVSGHAQASATISAYRYPPLLPLVNHVFYHFFS